MAEGGMRSTECHSSFMTENDGLCNTVHCNRAVQRDRPPVASRLAGVSF